MRAGNPSRLGSPMKFTPIRYEIAGAIGLLTLNRPKRRSAGHPQDDEGG
jgi:hypothetical protein